MTDIEELTALKEHLETQLKDYWSQLKANAADVTALVLRVDGGRDAGPVSRADFRLSQSSTSMARPSA